jgi:hypothetical protein
LCIMCAVVMFVFMSRSNSSKKASGSFCNKPITPALRKETIFLHQEMEAEDLGELSSEFQLTPELP